MKKAERERSEIIGHLIAGLKQRRLQLGLSQNQTAARAGLDQSMVGRLEKLERIPSIDTLLRFSDAVEGDFPEMLREAVTLVRPEASSTPVIHSANWKNADAPGNMISADKQTDQSGALSPSPLARREPVKMADIAAHLGVSRLTVSAVLNNRHGEVRISEETAARVRSAAAQLGYVRNHLAIATKTGKSFSVGVIVSNFSSEWVSRVLSGFLGSAKKKSYLVNIEDVSGATAEQEALTRLMEQRVGGIFCCNLNPDGNFPEILAETSQRYGCPVVSTISHPRLSGGRVDSDDEAGSSMAAQHLWELGHRRIMSIGLILSKRRTDAFIEEIIRCGGTIPPAWQLTRKHNDMNTETAVADLLSISPKKRPTAIFCASDELASVVMRAAHRCGLSIPDDLSVVGFSDERLAHLLDPRLTTIAQPFEEMGQRGAELLFDQMDGNTTGSNNLLPVRLVVRESTGRA